MKGKIVLIVFPFTDLTVAKVRSALVLFEAEKDVTVVFVSSRISKATAYDVLIQESHIEFGLTGLKTDSYLKIEKIATLSKKLVMGELGQIGPQLKKEINEKIKETLKL